MKIVKGILFFILWAASLLVASLFVLFLYGFNDGSFNGILLYFAPFVWGGLPSLVAFLIGRFGNRKESNDTY